MTINECVARIEKLFCGQADVVEIVGYIATLEHRIINEALSRYSAAVYDREFNGYNAETAGDVKLMAEPPYDDMYVHYVLAQIYLVIHEEAHYNNELEIFNKIFEDYKVHLIQNMRPDAPRRRRVR